MNPDSHNTQTPASSRKANGSVSELMATWKVKRPTYAVAPRLRSTFLAIILILALALVFSTVLFICARKEYFDFDTPFFDFSPSDNEEGTGSGVVNDGGDRPYADGVPGEVLLAWSDHIQVIPEGNLYSAYAALADLTTGEIIASRKAEETIYPASMTKVMTLIVVVENLPSASSLQDTITVSEAVYEEMARQGASGIGLEPGETMTVESMLYALMLKSDGIAACELAKYVAGSEAHFVELMNQKAADMGLTNTHFENPTGLFHENHKTTCREIATIMAYAMNMKLCRKILLTQSYTAACVNSEGKTFNYNLYHNLIVTQFDKITPNQPNGVKVAAGKTGFTDESRFCLVTYAVSSDGHGYVCVTAKSGAYAECIADYLTIYNTYVQP